MRKTIKQLREEAGMTQMQLAVQLDASLASVYNWEGGKSDPRANQLRRIAMLFGVSMDDIALSGDDELKTAA